MVEKTFKILVKKRGNKQNCAFQFSYKIALSESISLKVSLCSVFDAHIFLNFEVEKLIFRMWIFP